METEKVKSRFAFSLLTVLLWLLQRPTALIQKRIKGGPNNPSCGPKQCEKMMEFPPQICFKKKKVFKRSMRKSKEVLTFPNSVESLLKTNIKLFQRNFQCLSAVHKLPISPSNPALGSKRFLFFADFFPRDLLTVNFQFLI